MLFVCGLETSCRSQAISWRDLVLVPIQYFLWQSPALYRRIHPAQRRQAGGMWRRTAQAHRFGTFETRQHRWSAVPIAESSPRQKRRSWCSLRGGRGDSCAVTWPTR